MKRGGYVRISGVDRRSDIFCTGIVLWEALTGERLFDGPTPFDMVSAVRKRPIEAPSTVAPGLSPLVDPIVMKALRRPPSERYATAREMQQEILALIDLAGAKVDAPRLSMELGKIYGSQIATRALALRAAMAGEGDSDSLAQALAVEPLTDSSVTPQPGGTTDPDPLLLFAARPAEPMGKAAETPALPAHVERAFSVAGAAAFDADEEASRADIPSPEALAALAELEPDAQDVVDESAVEDGWDDRTQTRIEANDELLVMLAACKTGDQELPAAFTDRFGGALDEEAPTKEEREAVGAGQGDESETVPGNRISPVARPPKVTTPEAGQRGEAEAESEEDDSTSPDPASLHGTVAAPPSAGPTPEAPAEPPPRGRVTASPLALGFGALAFLLLGVALTLVAIDLLR